MMNGPRSARGAGLAATVLLGALALSACTAAAPSPSSTPAGPAPTQTQGSFAVPAPEDLARSYAQQVVEGMTLEQKIASMFMVHVGGSDPVPVQGYLHAEHPGGLLFLGDNVPGSTAEVAAFTGALHGPEGLGLLLATDEEGGDVARLSADDFDSALTLKSQPVQATTDAFTQRAALLKAAGVTVNFGIIADVTADPDHFIYDRALGTDAASASPRVAAAVDAEKGSVLSTVKHFPGHGGPAGDSHVMIPQTDMPFTQWQSDEAPPFQAGITSGAPLVMFGHLVYSAVDSLPATLSPTWHEIIRDQMGFDGVIVTDDMRMLEHSGDPAYADAVGNAIAAIGAGNDLLLYADTPELSSMVPAIAAAVRAGSLSEHTIDDAVLRDTTLRRELWAGEQAGLY
jgi:beta-N-acetylhexosaminidase